MAMGGENYTSRRQCRDIQNQNYSESKRGTSSLMQNLNEAQSGSQILFGSMIDYK